MATDDEFEPRLGRINTGGGKRARSYLSRVLAATNLARTATGRRSAFSGARISRGAGVGRLLARRDRYAAWRKRRVIVKARLVRLAGKGFESARAHLRYIQRDGVTREGQAGALYCRDAEMVDAKDWLDRQAGDRHQVRLIVSPEDGDQYTDLKDLTRRLMARVEEDLGTRLDWVAVDHFNTGHPHTHIIMRGKDERGRDLVIAPDYLTQGIRERAAELVDLDLGPRSDRDIEAHLRAEIDQARLTGIDRRLIAEMDANRTVATQARDPFQHSLRAGRLATLARLGLAERLPEGRWLLAERIEETLRRMGERGDIIRTMQRAYTDRGLTPTTADLAIYEPAAPDARPLTGRILARGLSNEHKDRHYLMVEATDGRTHYVDIGRGEAAADLSTGAIVRITATRPVVREVDRTIAAVAAANGGRYTIDAHLRHDPSATQAFAETHIRRLEAMRRTSGAVERLADGSWVIAPDHLDRVAAYEATRAREAPVRVETLSREPLDRLIGAQAATWLDGELVAGSPEPVREAGFGQEVCEAQRQRRQWLIAQGLAEEQANGTVFAQRLIDTLRRRELLRVAAQLSEQLALPFREMPPGGRVEGIYRRPVDLMSGRYALIERSREFTLLPWRPVLDRHVGKTVSGLVRDNGISWTIGRARAGPVIS